MDKSEFKKLIRECIKEVLIEGGVQQLDKHGNWADKPDGFTTPTPSSKPGKPPKVDYNKQMDDLRAGTNQLNKMGLGGLDEVEKDPQYVAYHSRRPGEEPFMMGGTKYEYVNAEYPNGKIDVAVYSYAGDVTYSYETFRKMHNITEGNITIKSPSTPKVRKSWGNVNPVSRIHGQGKEGHKPKYDRNRDKKWKGDIDEMTTTSAVQGFYGKNWVDPDPERKKMKSIATKSVGGEVTK